MKIPKAGDTKSAAMAGESVRITLNDGELAVLALALTETSTTAQREHAREVLRGLAVQAFVAVTDAWR